MWSKTEPENRSRASALAAGWMSHTGEAESLPARNVRFCRARSQVVVGLHLDGARGKRAGRLLVQGGR